MPTNALTRSMAIAIILAGAAAAAWLASVGIGVRPLIPATAAALLALSLPVVLSGRTWGFVGAQLGLFVLFLSGVIAVIPDPEIFRTPLTSSPYIAVAAFSVAFLVACVVLRNAANSMRPKSTRTVTP